MCMAFLETHVPRCKRSYVRFIVPIGVVHPYIDNEIGRRVEHQRENLAPVVGIGDKQQCKPPSDTFESLLLDRPAGQCIWIRLAGIVEFPDLSRKAIV